MKKIIEHFQAMKNLDTRFSSEINRPIVNYWNYSYATNDIYPNIICLNLQSQNTKHIKDFFSAIKQYNPHIIFTIENWREYPDLENYVKFISKDVYMNHIYIRNDIIRNRSLEYIPNGFRFEDINFRYFPPHSRKTTLFQNEIGDFNFDSNSWMRNLKHNFLREKRYDKPGGIGFKLSKLYDYSFFYTDSDHMGLYIRINQPFKRHLIADQRKVDNAIEDIIYNNSSELEYIYKHNRNYKYKMCDKIINPNIFSLSDWRNLYRDNNMKNNLQSDKIGSGIIEKPIGTNAYDDNNRPIKMISKSIIKNSIKHDNLDKIIKVLNNDKPNARIVCLKKKDPVTSLNDVRPIVILPASMKIREKTRIKLKDALTKRCDDRIKSFRPGKSINDCIRDIYDFIYDVG